jgi:uncharacterized protein
VPRLRALYAYHRDSNETPNSDAFIFVAATVRFKALAILLAPFLSFASDFNSRTSDEVQARRTIFCFFAILAPVVEAAPIPYRFNLSTTHTSRGPHSVARSLSNLDKEITHMEFLTCHFEFKSENTSGGYITGYGSIFGNIDSYGDVVAKGAFRKSIADVMNGVTAWPAMLLQHGDETSGGRTPIGVWTSMEEDDRGLKMTGKLAINTKRGKDAYELLKMRPRPALNGLSIGYRCTDYELHKVGSPARRTIKAVDLVEVSLVTFPANTRARVTGVKSGYEAAPEMTMRDLALADYEMLCKEMTRHNRNWR